MGTRSAVSRRSTATSTTPGVAAMSARVACRSAPESGSGSHHASVSPETTAARRVPAWAEVMRIARESPSSVPAVLAQRTITRSTGPLPIVFVATRPGTDPEPAAAGAPGSDRSATRSREIEVER